MCASSLCGLLTTDIAWLASSSSSHLNFCTVMDCHREFSLKMLLPRYSITVIGRRRKSSDTCWAFKKLKTKGKSWRHLQETDTLSTEGKIILMTVEFFFFLTRCHRGQKRCNIFQRWEGKSQLRTLCSLEIHIFTDEEKLRECVCNVPCLKE